MIRNNLFSNLGLVLAFLTVAPLMADGKNPGPRGVEIKERLKTEDIQACVNARRRFMEKLDDPSVPRPAAFYAQQMSLAAWRGIVAEVTPQLEEYGFDSKLNVNVELGKDLFQTFIETGTPGAKMMQMTAVNLSTTLDPKGAVRDHKVTIARMTLNLDTVETYFTEIGKIRERIIQNPKLMDLLSARTLELSRPLENDVREQLDLNEKWKLALIEDEGANKADFHFISPNPMAPALLVSIKVFRDANGKALTFGFFVKEYELRKLPAGPRA